MVTAPAADGSDGLRSWLVGCYPVLVEARMAGVALVLVIARLCRPSSELHIAEHFYRQTALADMIITDLSLSNAVTSVERVRVRGEVEFMPSDL